MFDTLSQTTAIIFAATSRAVLASPRPPAPCPGGCFWALMMVLGSQLHPPPGRCTRFPAIVTN